MTKKQEPGRATLRPDTVVRCALDLLDEQGLAAVSTRAVADRLGVRMNTVLWHVKSKTGLLELMADAIAGQISLDDLPEDGVARARALIGRYREALGGHRDGAALTAGTYAAQPHTLRFADRLVQALLDGEMSERAAVWTTWGLVYFTLGLVQEEQGRSAARAGQLAAAIAVGDYPALQRVAVQLGTEDFDERFAHGVDLLLV